MNDYTPSQKCLDLIKSFEGCRLTAYDDRMPGKVLKPGDRVFGTLTLGWGHVGGVYIGETITQEIADRLLETDVKQVGLGVKNAVTYPINQNQFDALVDFAFNVGLGNFHNSTMLKLINYGDLDVWLVDFDFELMGQCVWLVDF